MDATKGEIQAILERFNGCVTRAAAWFTEQGRPITRQGLREKCIRMGIKYNTSPLNYEYIEKMEKITEEFPTYDTFEKIYGDAIIISDLHAPFFSPTWLNRAITVGKSEGIKNLIIAGDVLDAKALSSFDCSDKQHTMEMEFTTVRQFLIGCLDAFDNIYLITGNHDERVARFTEQQFSLQFLYKHIIPDKKIHVSEYAYCTLNDDVRITHPYNYSSVPGAVPRALATKYHQHIIMGHTHRYAYTYDISGKYVACEIGGMFDVTKMDWQMLKDNKAPFWNNGFAMVKDGLISGFHDQTQWDSWM